MTEELIDNTLNEMKMSSAEYRYRLRNNTLCILQEEFNFEIVQFLGQGSYGEVIAVNSPDFEETVALKIIRSDDTWIGELMLWPVFDHQNVLPLLEFIQLPNADLFITPMMYRDMETVLEDEDFVFDQDFFDLAKKWLREVLDAFDYFHGQKLCHLDLKADNVLIDYGLNAVLCDFSFISHADEPVARYGVPLPYRPPETCLAFEKFVPVDGIKFDMWSYGILALNVFTNHFLKKRIHLEMKTWHRDIYPLLYEAMQITYFRYLMSTAFPLSSTEYEFSDAFNFVQYILRVQPEERPSVEDVVNHIFFKKGSNRIEKADDIWIFQEKTKCSCVQPENLLVLRKDNFERYKSRRTFKRTGILYQKRRKWEKPSTVLKNEKQVVESAFDVFENSDVVNNEQYDEKNYTLKIQETVDPSVEVITNLLRPVSTKYEVITPGDMVLTHTVEMNTQIEVHYNDDKFLPVGPTGDEASASEKGSRVENEKKECIGNDLEVNMMCIINERSFTNRGQENEKPTEVRLSMESEEFVSVAVDTDASVTLPNVSDITEEGLRKKDLRTWFREKLNSCTANIRKIMVTHKNVKENHSDSSLPKV